MKQSTFQSTNVLSIRFCCSLTHNIDIRKLTKRCRLIFQKQMRVKTHR